jgi:hypothetical protein
MKFFMMMMFLLSTFIPNESFAASCYQAKKCGKADKKGYNRPCKVWQCVPSCWHGQTENFKTNKCVSKSCQDINECGKKNNKPCKFWECTPSCVSGLYENFNTNKCLVSTKGAPPWTQSFDSIAVAARKANKSCKSLLTKMPKTNPGSSLERSALTAGKCLLEVNAGFNCQILNNAADMFSSLSKSGKQANKNAKNTAKAVESAMKSSHCKNLDQITKPLCGLLVGLANEGNRSFVCMSKLANLILEEAKKTNPKAGKVKLQSQPGLCTSMGEIAFDTAAKAAMMNASIKFNKIKALKKKIEFAQKVSTALNMQSDANKKLDKLIKKIPECDQ